MMYDSAVSAPRSAPVDPFLREVHDGLARPQKRLPCKYFYDEPGSRLFDAICELDEYYLTRAELAIMREHAGEMAALLGPGCALVEYGSGTSLKTRLLLDRLERPDTYVPVDVAREHLLAASAAIAADYPQVRVLPLCADFTAPLDMPEGTGGRRVVYFPGSTIGNFAPAEARALLGRIARTPGCSGALVGIDLQKPRATLEAAYDDARGVTAAFNLNLLARINRELGGDFDTGRFVHRARYDEVAGRIEMHLESAVDQVVRVGERAFAFRRGETIHTESSHKYRVDDFAAMAAAAGLALTCWWTDPQQQFAVVHLIPRVRAALHAV